MKTIQTILSIACAVMMLPCIFILLLSYTPEHRDKYWEADGSFKSLPVAPEAEPPIQIDGSVWTLEGGWDD